MASRARLRWPSADQAAASAAWPRGKLGSAVTASWSRSRAEGASLQPFAQNYVNILRQFGQDGLAARVQAETAPLGVR